MSAQDANARRVSTHVNHEGNQVATTHLTPASLTEPVKIVMQPPPVCIPIYPVRYGLVDTPLNKAQLPELSAKDYPSLQSKKHWGLRLLRPHSFVYMLYQQQGKSVVKGFQVTDDARFTAVPCPATNADDGLTLPYLPAPSKGLDSVYLFVADTELTSAKLNEVAAGTLVLPWKKITNWKQQFTTRVDLAKADKQKDAFASNLLSIAVPELASSSKKRNQAVNWSQARPLAPDGKKICSGMAKVAGTNPDNPGIAVALHDPVGAVSEMNFLLGKAFHALADWTETASRKKIVADSINSLAEAGRDRDAQNARQNDLVMGAIGPGVTGGAAEKARARVVKAGQDELNYRYSFCRKHDMDEWLSRTFPAQKKQLTDAIASATADVYHTFMAVKPYYIAALGVHDVCDAPSFNDLRLVAGETLCGLAHHHEGAKWLADQLSPDGPTRLMHMVLLGHPQASNLVQSFSGTLMDSSDKAVSLYAEKLLDVIGSIHPNAGSQQLSALVAALVSKGKLRSASAFMTSSYRIIMEMLGGDLVHHQRIPGGELPGYIRDQMRLKGVTGFRPQTLASRYNELVDVWESEDLSARVTDNLAKRDQLARRIRFWDNTKWGLSGLGTLLGLYNVATAMQTLGKADGLTFSNALNAAGAMSGLAAGSAGMVQTARVRAQHQAEVEKDTVKAKELKNSAYAAESYFIFFASLAALTMTFKGVADGFQENGKASTIDFLGAGVQGTLATAGGLHVWSRWFSDSFEKTTTFLVEKGGTAEAIGSGMTRFVASTEPLGWMLLLGGAIYSLFNEWHDAVMHEQKITNWIAKSEWGNGKSDGYLWDSYDLAPFASQQEETQALYELYQKPVIDTELNLGAVLADEFIPDFIYKADEGSVIILLPGWQPQTSAYEIVQYKDVYLQSVEQAYKDTHGKALPSADAIKVQQQNGTGIIHFGTKYRGPVKVTYWPNGFTQSQFSLTAES